MENRLINDSTSTPRHAAVCSVLATPEHILPDDLPIRPPSLDSDQYISIKGETSKAKQRQAVGEGE
jgi:hypothetical protein